MITRLRALALGALLIAGCTQPAPKFDLGPEVPPPLPVTDGATGPADLIKSLGIERPPEQLGAIERSFNSCTLRPDQPCGPRFVTLVNFQLLCRESEGTVSATPISLTPITTDQLLWNTLNLSGQTRTDERGFGQIVALGDRSLLSAHVTLRMGTRFVGVTLGEITKIVLPGNFCTKP